MTETTPKKFKYQKDQRDWVVIWIILFTVVCFGLIIYGMKYFEPSFTTPDGDYGQDGINEFQRNAAELQRQIESQLGE